ncbi:type IV pilus assembly protein PilM [Cellulomonas denverensis]|uniref:Type IV pilus assembly protein PilM n=1 Tax=Cellulomonas denverensis TaxID=264297 RepID=A0A7X6KT87_9CELL|nr:type IV pilus assembly protein PilM [Cellulomonas denverensis]NKY21871.1 type IV pilus assembly protein PilM [Cellulomonas denverensis]GIG24239.1 cell division protein FtsA [Cellulomonas denverensis]
MAKTRVIGLDIGTTAVRAAEVEFDGGPGAARRGAPGRVVRAGTMPLPWGAVHDGEVAEPATVSSAIKRLWSDRKFGSKEVVVGVGNQRVMVREFDMPQMPPAQLRAALPFQVEGLLPVAAGDALLDFHPVSTSVGAEGPMVHGLLVAATAETVLANTRAVELAGLRPVMVDLNAFAVARLQARSGFGSGVRAFVDIGARVTNVSIVVDGMPRFVRILPAGGHDVTEALTGALDVPAAEAEVIKRRVGVGLASAPEDLTAKQIIAEVVTGMVDSIRNTLVYYASSNPGGGVEQIVLSGGGSFLPGLGQYLASATRVAVAVGEPLQTFPLAKNLNPQSLGGEPSTYAVPLGLAMGVAA